MLLVRGVHEIPDEGTGQVFRNVLKWERVKVVVISDEVHTIEEGIFHGLCVVRMGRHKMPSASSSFTEVCVTTLRVSVLTGCCFTSASRIRASARASLSASAPSASLDAFLHLGIEHPSPIYKGFFSYFRITADVFGFGYRLSGSREGVQLSPYPDKNFGRYSEGSQTSSLFSVAYA